MAKRCRVVQSLALSRSGRAARFSTRTAPTCRCRRNCWASLMYWSSYPAHDGAVAVESHKAAL